MWVSALVYDLMLFAVFLSISDDDCAGADAKGRSQELPKGAEEQVSDFY